MFLCSFMWKRVWIVGVHVMCLHTFVYLSLYKRQLKVRKISPVISAPEGNALQMETWINSFFLPLTLSTFLYVACIWQSYLSWDFLNVCTCFLIFMKNKVVGLLWSSCAEYDLFSLIWCDLIIFLGFVSNKMSAGSCQDCEIMFVFKKTNVTTCYQIGQTQANMQRKNSTQAIFTWSWFWKCMWVL